MKIVAYIILLVGLTSCSKDFLDKKPIDSAPDSDVLNSIEGIESALIGSYSLLQSPDYYGRNFIIIQDVFTDNAILSSKNSGQYSSIYSWQVNEGNEYLTNLWKTAYAIIANNNNIISALNSIETENIKDKLLFLGEAKALRALVYFDLVRTFAQTYSAPASSDIKNANGMGGHIGVPLVLDALNRDSISYKKRSTVNEIYTQITNDLLAADTLLANQNINSFRFNSRSVEALLSIVYLNMSNFNKSLEYAEKVIYNYDYSLLTDEEYIESWELNETSESIFSVNMSDNDYAGTNSLGHMLSPLAYGAISPSNDYSSLLEENDIRNELLQKQTILFSNKYPGRNNTIGLDNIPVIRLSELYLIQAECYAEKAKKVSGFTLAAQQSLLSIAGRADESVNSISSSGDNLMSLIQEEYRKEFLFEGKRYFQLKRTNTDIIRNTCSSTDCSLKAFNYKFAFPIPISEINANDSIIQNPGY